MAGHTRRGRGGNLPAEVTSFIGRRAEETEVRRLLTQGRLVTLTGVGGVGKTRLAVHAAAGVERAFRDGAWLVDIAAVQDPALLPDTIRVALGIALDAPGDPLDALVAHLRDRQLLLILDNSEQVADDVAALAEGLLRVAAGLRVLVTSRHTLGCTAEHVMTVLPLPLPDPWCATDDEPAVRLFTERGRAAQPGFALDPTTAPVVARICRRLDGLPLAIELAAVQLRAFSPEQLLQRLDDHGDVLLAGRRGGPERQRTLRSTIDWSYRLCSAPEQLLWARLSVLAGGFDLESAEAVCAGTGLPAEAVPEALTGLVDKSVLLPTGTGDGPSRFRMLDTIRHHGREKLRERGEERALRRRHRDWLLALAKQSGAAWFGPHQPAHAARFRTEHANVRAALSFCVTEPGEGPAGLELFAALSFYWIGCGATAEGRYWATRVLAADAEPSPALASCRWIAAAILIGQGREAEIAQLLDASERLATQLGDELTLAYLPSWRAADAFVRGDLAAALALENEAQVRLGALGRVDLVAGLSVARLAMIHQARGEIDRAVAVGERGRALCQRYGDRFALGYLNNTLVACRYSRGEYALAMAEARESLRHQRGSASPGSVAMMVDLLAWICGAAGEHTRAAELLGGSSVLWRYVGPVVYGAPPWLAEHERCERAARRSLGDAGFEQAFARGARLDAGQVVDLALDEFTPRPTPAGGPVPGPLTRRQREIAALVAAGLTDKQIAARLVISPRTAEAHVSTILAKLGLTNRVQVAAWVAEHP